jgi:hypothetical protein
MLLFDIIKNMAEQESNNSQQTYLTAMTPSQTEAHTIGIEIADAAFLQEVGRPGVTTESLHLKWFDAYVLGRNAVEHTLGYAQPYAEDSIAEIRSRQRK